MAGRIRTLKPEWLEDEILASMTDAERLLSVALILLADDYGNGRAHPVSIAASVWGMAAMSCDPHETLRKTSGALEALHRIGFIQLYSVRKQQYFAICNWTRHQKVSHPGKPRVPGPDESDEPSGDPPEPRPSGDPPEGLTPDLDLDLDPDHYHRPVREPAPDPRPTGGGGAVIALRPRRPVTDLAEATDHLRLAFEKRWTTFRGAPPGSDHRSAREAATWVWETAEADPERFVALAEQLLDRWFADAWVVEHKNSIRYPMRAFQGRIYALWSERDTEVTTGPAPRVAEIEARLEAIEDELATAISMPADRYEPEAVTALRAEREALRAEYRGILAGAAE